VQGGSLDVYENAPLAIFGREFRAEVEAVAYTPPACVEREITADTSLSGNQLSQTFGAAIAFEII
jgi:hypothetical protein